MTISELIDYIDDNINNKTAASSSNIAAALLELISHLDDNALTAGSGIIIASNVISLSNAYARGLISATTPLSYDSSTGIFTIASASTSTTGVLTSTDWNTFNNKASAVGAPQGQVLFGVTGGYSADANLFWNNTSKYLGSGTNNPSNRLHVLDSNIPILGERTTAVLNNVANCVQIKLTTTGDMANGFGPGYNFVIRDNAGVDNSIAYIAGVRDGADNSGAVIIATKISGAFKDAVTVKGNGNVLIGTSTDIAAALLNLSSNTKGFLPPVMTTSQFSAISSKPAGLHAFDTTTGRSTDYDGTNVKQVAYTSDIPIAGTFSGVGTATTTFTVTIGQTMANNTYKVTQPGALNVLSAALCYITNKTTTTFDVVYLTGLTGTVEFDWSVFK